jgi:diaminohydroxyphosphoribosylaminopyrimidine deaminase/5-amino-6-(5-phosphoribosylamino)uracil reductase
MYNPLPLFGARTGACPGRPDAGQALQTAEEATVGFDERDRSFMERALALAEQGRGYVEPNPMVGAVVVKDGRIVGEGHYKRFGGPHAEVFALQEAGERVRGATLYVTLEPCDHAGKTPACAPMVAQAGLGRVVICTADPTDVRPRGGLEMLAQRNVLAEDGLCREEAVRLNAGFFKLAATGRPLVTAKWAMSADGKIATATGESRYISSAASRRLVHEVRGQVDCIIVGSRTVARDDPLLTCRDAERRRTAARLVLCGASAPSPGSRLVQTVSDAPVMLAYPAGRPPEGLAGLAELGCEALPVEGDEPRRVDIGRLLSELGRRRMTNVLVEGGGEVLGSFFDAGFVDRVMVFVAPLVIGGAGATPPVAAATPVAGRGARSIGEAVRLQACETRALDGDVLIQGWAVDPLRWAP